MIKRAVLILLFGAIALATACSGAGSDDETPAATATSRTTVSDPTSSGGSGSSEVGPDGAVLPTPQPDAALNAALESITGFDITDVTFRGDDVTVKYDQVVNEPPELLLLRWLDFASVAVTFLDSPRGDIVLVPQVENADIASIRLRAVDVVDFLDGKRSLEDLLVSIEIS